MISSHHVYVLMQRNAFLKNCIHKIRIQSNPFNIVVTVLLGLSAYSNWALHWNGLGGAGRGQEASGGEVQLAGCCSGKAAEYCPDHLRWESGRPSPSAADTLCLLSSIVDTYYKCDNVKSKMQLLLLDWSCNAHWMCAECSVLGYLCSAMVFIAKCKYFWKLFLFSGKGCSFSCEPTETWHGYWFGKYYLLIIYIWSSMCLVFLKVLRFCSIRRWNLLKISLRL